MPNVEEAGAAILRQTSPWGYGSWLRQDDSWD
jgi:hypothetical protein